MLRYNSQAVKISIFQVTTYLKHLRIFYMVYLSLCFPLVPETLPGQLRKAFGPRVYLALQYFFFLLAAIVSVTYPLSSFFLLSLSSSLPYCPSILSPYTVSLLSPLPIFSPSSMHISIQSAQH